MAISRVSPADLKARVEAGDSVTVVDARLRYAYEHSSLLIPQALRVSPISMATDVVAVPTTHDVVVYDSDPDEVTALDVAARLAARGARVSVLTGGLNGWMAAGGATATKLAVGQPAPAADAPPKG